MDAYVFQAALYCPDCASIIKKRLNSVIKSTDLTKNPPPLDKEDSDEYPQGPYSDGGGESDCPEHCDTCGEFLENPLTSDGYDYVKGLIKERFNSGRGNNAVLKLWAEFYDIPFENGCHSSHIVSISLFDGRFRIALYRDWFWNTRPQPLTKRRAIYLGWFAIYNSY